MKIAPCWFAEVTSGNTSRLCRRNSAPSPPKPRGGPSALAGVRGEAGQARYLAAHTHALFAQKVQRKVSNCVADFAVPVADRSIHGRLSITDGIITGGVWTDHAQEAGLARW